MPNIGIMGLAGSGKDTAGKWLTENRGYERVAFADPLKEAALRVDPIVDPAVRTDGRGTDDYRLSDVVNALGWEHAKDEVREVRRFLQELGASIRALDPDFWLRQALKKATDVNERFGRPVVITDVRYENEVAALWSAGFHLVYIDRPGTPRMAHESEQLTEENAEYVIQNFGFLEDFHAKVERFWERVNRFESHREDARSLPFA
ncbi:deoxynucleotide monophosphate kinase family protein [Streptomyces tubercidicus]